MLSNYCTQVYDVTAFWRVHPGGRVILTYAGRDATDVFATFHAATSWALLREHQIGELAAEVRSGSDLGVPGLGRLPAARSAVTLGSDFARALECPGTRCTGATFCD